MYENSYTIQNLNGLITNTYILSAIIGIVMFFLSLIIANLISYEGGKNPRDPKKRKYWFWTLASIAPTINFTWNYIYVAKLISVPVALDKFYIQNAIATGVCLFVYVIIGFVVSKLLAKSKYGTIFN